MEAAKQPNGELIFAKHKTHFNLFGLSEKAREALIFPKLKSGNILSLSKVTNDGCEIILNNDKILITKNTNLEQFLHNNQIVARGKKEANQLWYIEQTFDINHD